MTATCQTCPFMGRESGQMFCRRYPPEAALGPVNTIQGTGLGWQAAFPPVLPTWWCGEHPERRGARVSWDASTWPSARSIEDTEGSA